MDNSGKLTAELSEWVARTVGTDHQVCPNAPPAHKDRPGDLSHDATTEMPFP